MLQGMTSGLGPSWAATIEWMSSASWGSAGSTAYEATPCGKNVCRTTGSSIRYSMSAVNRHRSASRGSCGFAAQVAPGGTPILAVPGGVRRLEMRGQRVAEHVLNSEPVGRHIDDGQ